MFSIRGSHVGFVNPSLRDYLTGYLSDEPLLLEIARSARQTDWAEAVWRFGVKMPLAGDALTKFALCFADVAQEFPKLPTWMVVKREHISQRYAKGLSNTDRIKLLIRWWGETNHAVFRCRI